MRVSSGREDEQANSRVHASRGCKPPTDCLPFAGTKSLNAPSETKRAPLQGLYYSWWSEGDLNPRHADFQSANIQGFTWCFTRFAVKTGETQPSPSAILLPIRSLHGRKFSIGARRYPRIMGAGASLAQMRAALRERSRLCSNGYYLPQLRSPQ